MGLDPLEAMVGASAGSGGIYFLRLLAPCTPYPAAFIPAGSTRHVGGYVITPFLIGCLLRQCLPPTQRRAFLAIFQCGSAAPSSDCLGHASQDIVIYCDCLMALNASTLTYAANLKHLAMCWLSRKERPWLLPIW